MEPTEVQSPPEAELLPGGENTNPEVPDAELRAVVEAVIYVADEPLSADQIATALQQPAAKIGRVLEELTAEYNKPEHGLTIREIAGGYKMSTKPEHHEGIRAFVKNLKPPLKLSLPALETLALIAYKQPITAPEIMEVRGVQGAGVLKTLVDRKLIATAGRKNVVGKPMLYKTTRDFLVQFGLRDLNELPTLKEFEDLGRLSLGDEEPAPVAEAAAAPTHASSEPVDASSESVDASSDPVEVLTEVGDVSSAPLDASSAPAEASSELAEVSSEPAEGASTDAPVSE